MFRNTITRTPLTSAVANSCFANINGDAWREDISFLATLRALVSPRIKDDERIFLRFNDTSYDDATLRSHPVKTCVNVSNAGSISSGEIVIHNFSNAKQENNYAWLELMKSSFEEHNEGWHRLEKVTDFFRKTFYVLCFIHPEEKKVILFIDDLDIRKLHYLQCSILAFLPWYFNPEEGVSDIEMSLISSLREKNSENYESCLAKIAEKYDFRSINIRQKLKGFETRFEKAEIERVRRNISDCISTINNYNTQIGNVLKEKYGYEIRLLGLEAKVEEDSGESEIMEYFLANKSLILESVNSSSITFAVKTYLQYFDEDMADNVIRRKTSCVYHPDGTDGSRYIPAEDMALLMKAIFIEQKLRVRFCAKYRFDMNGNVEAISRADFSDSEYKDYMPNTHIDKYSCMGNYRQVINELLIKNDYISAIEQCIASCKSLNFGDSIVLAEFMKELYGNSTRDGYKNNRCIELPTGDVVKPVDAIKWLRACEANESTNQEATNE